MGTDPDNPPPPEPDFNAINSLTFAQRSSALTITQNTNGNGVTQSTEALDSVSAITDSDGNLMFHVVNGERVAVMVDNSNPDADWAENPPPLLSTSYIFDSASFASQTLADYNDGDFYAVTGFWYRDSDDFGVFVDGSPRTEPLPTTGSATYRGNVGGYSWSSTAAGNSVFTGDVVLQASISGGNIAMGGTGNATIDEFPVQITFQDITNNDGGAVFIDGSISCQTGCEGIDISISNWDGRFVGNPVNNAADGADSDGWPAGFVGAFSLRLPSIFDAIGTFGAIHENLCAATAADGSAAFCTKPTTP